MELTAKEKTGTRSRDWILFDSTTSPLMRLSGKMPNLGSFDVSLSLAGDLLFIGNRKGRHIVTRSGDVRVTKAGLLEAVLSEQLDCSLLSVSALVGKKLLFSFSLRMI